MNRFALSVNLDPPQLKPDTLVEITSTGDLEAVDAAQPQQTTKLDDLMVEATKGFYATYANPAKLGEVLKHHHTMQEVVDARLGADDSLVAIAQPSGSEQVVPAAEAALQHKGTLITAAPALATQCDWAQTEDDLKRLRTVTEVKDKALLRAKNLTILEAHLRQRIHGNLSVVQKHAAPVISNNRSLEQSMAPFSALFNAPAEKAAETKRTIAKVLKKQKKVKQGQQADGKAPADQATRDSAAPAKDSPDTDKKSGR